MEIVNVHPDIRKFIELLDYETRAYIDKIIAVLAFYEHRLAMPYSKKIEKNLYELRIKTSKNIRIFYTFYNNKVFLLHIINKEKQKLSPKDIDTARKRLAYLHS